LHGGTDAINSAFIQPKGIGRSGRGGLARKRLRPHRRLVSSPVRGVRAEPGTEAGTGSPGGRLLGRRVGRRASPLVTRPLGLQPHRYGRWRARSRRHQMRRSRTATR
jgi:hypothetical protein